MTEPPNDDCPWEYLQSCFGPPSINFTWLSALRDGQVDHLGSAAPVDMKISNETLSFIGWLQEAVHVLTLCYT